ncbi:uncharacterized protein CELE_E02A10.4 [Caenorhabditis elegans]|uniref:Secreted protein n=1 Tax=Caenorhabditis elegans TaxID=6239 RepID=Q8I4L7_CAEEL|nr:Secreted protein [Caenorhabditis elegans]CAD54130.1 Secreted protein [Caenorhabditis elegans]|eukprot:NP_872188.1 Uncharacterized protein CELE_E02A10.4 [Caenorhabditis elegans]
MLTKVIIAISIIVLHTALGAVIRESPEEFIAVDCSTLNECNGNWGCVEYLMSLYRLDCVTGPVSKKSPFVNGGGKRGGMKNLQKIFLGSYMTKLR